MNSKDYWSLPSNHCLSSGNLVAMPKLMSENPYIILSIKDLRNQHRIFRVGIIGTYSVPIRTSSPRTDAKKAVSRHSIVFTSPIIKYSKSNIRRAYRLLPELRLAHIWQRHSPYSASVLFVPEYPSSHSEYPPHFSSTVQPTVLTGFGLEKRLSSRQMLRICYRLSPTG